MSKVKVAHSSLKNQKIVTRFGEIQIDINGQAEVEPEIAKQLVATYGKMFALLNGKTVPVLAELPAPVAKTVVAHTDTTNPSLEPAVLAAEERKRTTERADVRAEKPAASKVKKLLRGSRR